MSIPLLTTKLNIPPRRPNLVARLRLTARLGEALRLGQRLTLVSARAGSGKTTLVSEWLHQQERPAGWLSLDAMDNAPRRFCSYLYAALQQLGVQVNSAALGQFEAPQLPQAETLVVELVNDLASSSRPFILVLDDYHLIQNEWIHQAVGFLVEHQPPEMHLILVSRVDPPLPLARLRGRGQLSEIRDQDLRFTAQEAAQFLNQAMGLDLTVEAVASLERRTEGWIAGLQLAALSIQGRQQGGDLEAFIAAFGGSNRFILDYLMEEVLKGQPPAIQEFLMETSILERMCAGLCDAVRSGGATAPARLNSQAVLAQLERANLFVISLDDERRWYRYHHLFADLLKSTLRQRRSAGEVRELHRRASQWHQGQGSLEEAMVHAIDAQDFERAAAMIVENIVAMLAHSQPPVLLGWIEKLPEEIVRGQPWIDVYRANTLALTSQLEGVEPLLEEVERRIQPGDPQAAQILGHIAAIRAYCANLSGDAGRAIEMAALTRRYLPEEHLTARGMAAYALADTYFASDDLESAGQALREMLRAGEKTGQLMLTVTALCEQATIEKAQGRLHQAQELYGEARQRMAARNGLGSRLRCAYEFGLADLLRERDQLESAYEHAMTGIEHRKRLGGYLVSGDLALMRILQARGDVDGALAALRNAEQFMQTYPFQLATTTEFKAARVVQWLAAGDVETASRWAEACNGGSELEQIALARLRLAQGRAAEAQRTLEWQRRLAEAGGRSGRLIEILSLQALSLEAQGLSGEAEASLSQAVYLARPEGYRRVFLDLGQPLCKLLERVEAAQASAAKAPGAPGAQAAGGYMRELLEAFRQERQAIEAAPPALANAPPDALTERELDVLRLLAEGLPNKAIAGRLVVAPSTVKQHLKNIYAKLDVHSRTQAVARGRELELL